MTRKARVWSGSTLLLILIFNYAMLGMPLVKRKADLNARKNEIIVSNTSDDDYVLDLFRKETALIDKKLGMMNSISISLAVLIISWTVFGLVFPGKKSKSRRER